MLELIFLVKGNNLQLTIIEKGGRKIEYTFPR
jgi:hypothetical protein